MRLINTDTLEFADFLGPTRPPYAILSHTWEDGEVSLREMTDPSPSVTSKNGYRKVVDYCRLAAREGYAWAWIDTCCIDKTNHAELAESINSMFRWYEEAAVCHVFLADLVADAELEDALPRCRWFTRGWTLQELIAPNTVHFHDQSWTMRGTKADLITELAAITGILGPVLDRGLPLHEVCVGVRMSWASNRETTRPEDGAYCLLGIFDVNMPMIYGEGSKAFRRLQHEIIRHSNDLTIFACNHKPGPFMHVNAESTNGSGPDPAPVLASSPRDFEMHSARQARGLLRTLRPRTEWLDVDPEYAITNKGLRITTTLSVLYDLDGRSPERLYFLALGEVRYDTEDGNDGKTREIIGMILDKVGPNTFLRRGGPLHGVPASRPTAPVLTPQLGFYISMGDYRTSHVTRELVSRHSVVMPRCGAYPVKTVKLDAANETGGEPRANLTPSDAVVQVVKAIPESHWDETNRYFYRPGKDRLVFAILFSVEFERRTDHLICIMEHREFVLPPAYLFDLSTQPEVARWFFGRKATGEGSFLEDLPHYRLPKWMPSEVVVCGVSFSVTAQELKAGDTPSSAAKVIELSLDITKHNTASNNATTEHSQSHGQREQNGWIKRTIALFQTR